MGFEILNISPLGFNTWADFREDLRGKLLTDHIGRFNGISTDDLAEYYFGQRGLEASIKMESELQQARQILLSRGIILKNSKYRWHIVGETIEAYDFIRNRSLRIVRAHQRTKVVATISQSQFPELAETATVKALGSMQKTVDKLREGITKDDTKQLPERTEGEDKKNED